MAKTKRSPIEVAKALKGIDFPAERDDLLEQARDNDADQDLLDVLEQLPDREYENMADVERELGDIQA